MVAAGGVFPPFGRGVRMRVCLVSRELSPFFGAGIGTYTAQMARAWADAGHEVHILTQAHPGLAERGPALFPGIRLHATEPERGLAGRAGYRFAFLRHAMAVYEALLGYHAAAPFDFIEFPEYWAEGYFAIRARRTLGRFEGATLGVRLHTPTHECRLLNGESWLDEELASLEHAEEATIREADLICSPSNSLLDQVSQRLALEAGAPRRAIVPYPFTPEAAPTGAQAPPLARPTVLYIGRLERRKGVHMLVDVGQQLLAAGLDLSFRFVGADTASGPMGSSMLEHLRSLVEPRWRERFEFTGPRPRAELPATIRASAASGGACCFPSLWENFPNACVEAMAAGAAVVGSDAGGMAEIIEDGRSGILFRSGDPESLAAALRRVLSDAALRQSTAAAAPARVAALCEPAAVVRQTIRAAEAARVPAISPAGGAPVGGFSVLVPTLGDPAAVQATLASVAGQTLAPGEVLALSVARGPAHDWGPGVRSVAYDAGGSAFAAGLRAAAGRWAVWVRPGVRLEPACLEKMAAALDRNPGVAFLSVLASPTAGQIERIPLGLDRDLLPALDCAWSGALVIDRAAALAATGTVEWVGPGEEWSVCCALAERGAASTVLPEILAHGDTGAKIPEPDQDRFAAYIAHMHPALPQRPDRTLRIMAWQRQRLRQRADDAAVAVQGQVNALKDKLAAAEEGRRDAEARARWLRYRAADRIAGALGLLGLRRPARAAASVLARKNGHSGGGP